MDLQVDNNISKQYAFCSFRAEDADSRTERNITDELLRYYRVAGITTLKLLHLISTSNSFQL
jgi:hypothetical protein